MTTRDDRCILNIEWSKEGSSKAGLVRSRALKKVQPKLNNEAEGLLVCMRHITRFFWSNGIEFSLATIVFEEPASSESLLAVSC